MPSSFPVRARTVRAIRFPALRGITQNDRTALMIPRGGERGIVG
jgi:hypothetical protein